MLYSKINKKFPNKKNTTKRRKKKKGSKELVAHENFINPLRRKKKRI